MSRQYIKAGGTKEQYSKAKQAALADIAEDRILNRDKYTDRFSPSGRHLVMNAEIFHKHLPKIEVIPLNT
jgi:hypothetical protein